MKRILSIRDLSKNFEEKKVLNGVNFEMNFGERVALIGPSGCGKTTLLRCVAGLLKFDSGTIDLNTSKIGYVFQEDRLIPWRTVKQNLLFVDSNEKKILEVLTLVGLEESVNLYPSDLSGGMRQRVNIARALVKESDIILLDEPFQSLDFEIKIQLIKDVHSLSKTFGFACIMITHSIREALSFADRICILSPSPSNITVDIVIDLPDKHRNIFDHHLLKKELEILEKTNIDII